MRRFLRFLPLLLIVAALVWYFLPRPQPSPASAPPQPSIALSALAEKPDWRKLDAFQETITRAEFERLLTTIFTTDATWRESIRLSPTMAEIDTGEPGKPFVLRFSTHPKAAAHTWRTAAHMPPAPANLPLHGIRIAIDPGHIGGEWAQIEERWLAVPGSPVVKEGDMTLLVAKLLKPRLEKLGASVFFVRNKAEPVTPLRPSALEETARAEMGGTPSPESIEHLAARLFYRTAEIRARAALVNGVLKPDLVLCLHFNADPWNDPANPTLVPRTHFHMLLNGAYTGSEIRLADQRFAMLEKLLSGTFPEEAAAGAVVAEIFAARAALPPYIYPPEAANARPVNGNSFLWARNLLANRLYDCPVLFMEPYVMNSTVDHPRLAAGDYAGEREIAGKKVCSIFREYADFLTEGLAEYYRANRPPSR